MRRLLDAGEFKNARFEFRPSRMPYCALQHLWFTVGDRAGTKLRKRDSFMSDYYTSFGTAIHTATQRWLGRLQILYGYWRCDAAVETAASAGWKPPRRTCDDLTVHGPSLMPPDGCPTCHGPLRYEEIRLRHKKSGLSGQPDGLLKIPQLNLEEDEFVLLEIKTTDSKKMQQLMAPGGLYRHYRMQNSIYAHLLQQRGYRIRASLFLFVPRDNFKKVSAKFYTDIVKFSQQTFEEIVDEYLRTQSCIEEGTYDYAQVEGVCTEDGGVDDCPWRATCLSEVASEQFVTLHKKAYGAEPVSTPVFPVRQCAEGDK